MRGTKWNAIRGKSAKRSGCSLPAIADLALPDDEMKMTIEEMPGMSDQADWRHLSRSLRSRWYSSASAFGAPENKSLLVTRDGDDKRLKPGIS